MNILSCCTHWHLSIDIAVPTLLVILEHLNNGFNLERESKTFYRNPSLV